MKQKQRVPKGEKYWFINENFDAEYDYEQYALCDDSRFDSGNYFATEAEVNTMVTKLRAVLRGAEVIEMPESNEVDMIQREIGLEVGGEDEELIEAASLGAIKMINWMNDKIIK